MFLSFFYQNSVNVAFDLIKDVPYLTRPLVDRLVETALRTNRIVLIGLSSLSVAAIVLTIGTVSIINDSALPFILGSIVCGIPIWCTIMHYQFAYKYFKQVHLPNLTAKPTPIPNSLGFTPFPYQSSAEISLNLLEDMKHFTSEIAQKVINSVRWKNNLYLGALLGSTTIFAVLSAVIRTLNHEDDDILANVWMCVTVVACAIFAGTTYWHYHFNMRHFNQMHLPRLLDKINN